MSRILSVVKTCKYPEFVVGLSGGIGCGKSAALKIFAELGCETIESDRIVHELYEDTGENGAKFRKMLLDKWGVRILTDNKIDRRKIGQLVFKDKNELEWLNSNIHPHVFNKADEIISSNKNKIVIFDIPLLFELNLETKFYVTISIWTTKEQQISRLKTRNWTKCEIEERLNNQLSPDEKLEKATYGIINTGSLDMLTEQCKQILNNLKKGYL